MLKITFILAMTLGLISCNVKTDKPIDNKPLTAEQLNVKLDKIILDFNQPVFIDSSVYVMYPLTLQAGDDPVGSYGSSSGRPTTYWNIIFYNTATGEYHLLDDTLKMAIYSYNPRNASSGTSSSSSSFGFDDIMESGYNQVDRLMYFSITTHDFNHDGKLNSEDPNYLYVADKSGRHFKQISPVNLNVNSWETIKSANRILMMVTKDSNGDKKFNEQDETFPLVYDLTKNTTSTEIFNADFKTKLKKQLDEKWMKKK